eukprot:TRINITY_DN8279_c0_g1_i1.p1 TRINITY_DN8279_c0_g1~~TRINITY_DN8279_c0_g1_i1.p1  ORF type:complete len:422 (+),score=66.23 TRINITY_DN8279_c0_g1_i1:66-1268(+)
MAPPEQRRAPPGLLLPALVLVVAREIAAAAAASDRCDLSAESGQPLCGWHWLSFAAGCTTAAAVALLVSGLLWFLRRGRQAKSPAAGVNSPPQRSPTLAHHGGSGAITPPDGASVGGQLGGTLVEFQWYVKQLPRPRGSLISPNFGFADLEWQLSIDGGDGGVYLAANGRGVRASYRISVVEGDLSGAVAATARNWVSSGFEEFGEQKWGCMGVMELFYGKDIVVTAAFARVISPVNHITPGGQWLVGIDSYGDAPSEFDFASPRPAEPQGSGAPCPTAPPAPESPPRRARPPPGVPITYRGTPLTRLAAACPGAGPSQPRARPEPTAPAAPRRGSPGRGPAPAAGGGGGITYRGIPLRNILAVPLARGVEPRIIVEQCSPRARAAAAPRAADALGSALR